MKHRIYIAVLSFILLFSGSHYIFGATADGLKEQINNINAQIQALDREIQQYQNQISQTTEEGNTLASLIKELTLTRSKLLKELDQTQKKITATNLAINGLDQDIDSREKSIELGEKAISQLIRNLNQTDGASVTEKLFSKKSLSETSLEYNSILTLNKEVRDRILEIKKQKNELSLTKNKKEVEQKNLSLLKKSLTNKKLAVDISKKEKDTLLKETKNKESNYKKLLAESQKRRDVFEKDLQNYEAQLKFILNPKLLPKDGSAVLDWPLDSVFITQLFGKTVSSKRLYTSGSHSGVDFRASIGTPVKAMASGTVIGTGDTDVYCKGASFGKWVFIKYDNGLSSTFGHLSVISSSAGQKVNAGDVVALSGNTGHSTGPHLHVTVYASEGADVKTIPSLSCNGKTFTMPIAPVNAYLDPMLYLPSYTPSMVKSSGEKRD
jgi:murein DD-endopeptidase MepM/ murein hydrolase activator NlpD